MRRSKCATTHSANYFEGDCPKADNNVSSSHLIPRAAAASPENLPETLVYYYFFSDLINQWK
jgi:hypothetical protein